jgi:hypothetical protein
MLVSGIIIYLAQAKHIQMKIKNIILALLLGSSTIFADPEVVCWNQDKVSVAYLTYRKAELEQIYSQLDMMCTLHTNAHLRKAKQEIKQLLNEINEK